MHQRISKKIFIYLFIFLILASLNNVKLSKFSIPKINNLEIFGLENDENEKIYKDIEYIKNKNIFSLNKNKILNIIYKNKAVEEFFIFKNYPSNLKIKIKKTNFVAITKKNNLDYYVGSNGNLIKIDNFKKNLPFVFGDINVEDFLRLKVIIDDSSFNFNKIKNFYYFKSKRWDLETANGLIIKLPLERVKLSLEILSSLSIAKEFKNMKMIDLRQKKQVIINE
jgi:cell division protein FtsQ